jgi:hypothetical protein
LLRRAGITEREPDSGILNLVYGADGYGYQTYSFIFKREKVFPAQYRQFPGKPEKEIAEDKKS